MAARPDLNCSPDTADCRPPQLNKRQAAGLRGIAQSYIERGRPRAEQELDWFKEQPSLRFTIELAAFALNSSGKRYRHQTRLKRLALRRAEELLVANEARIAACRSFDSLLSLLEAFLLRIPGLGELYCYDTALRIGAKLDLFPDQVYLHRGTRDGARALGLDHKARALHRNHLPKEWRDLPAHEIEDILCIFKDRFGKLAAGRPLTLSRRSWCD